MDPSQTNGAAMQGTPVPSAVGDGKRRRRPTTFAGFLTSDRQLDNLITDRQPPPGEELVQGGEDAGGADTGQDHEDGQERGASASPSPGVEATTASQLLHAAPEPPVKRRKSSVSAKGQNGPPPPQLAARPPNSSAAAPYPVVKKVVGVQNATRKALEWLQYGDLSLLDLAQSLPKLSKARVEIVMEALRAAGLVTLVRKHAPDMAGDDRVAEVYRFSAGRSAAEALEIGGGKPVALGSISKRIKSSQAELEALNVRINVLKAEAAKAEPEPQQLLDILRHFMKQDKTLEEDPFYSVAFKATCAAATKAAKAAAAARAASEAEAEAERAERAAREAAEAKKQPSEAAAAAAAATEAAAAEAIRNAVVAAASESEAAIRTAAAVVSAAELSVPSAVTVTTPATVAAVSPAASTPAASIPPANTFRS